MMENSLLNQYLASVAAISGMEKRGLISHQEFLKAEEFLAKKYCIKIGSIYRSNDLINTRNRVIYMMQQKEVEKNEESNKNRSVTKIKQED